MGLILFLRYQPYFLVMAFEKIASIDFGRHRSCLSYRFLVSNYNRNVQLHAELVLDEVSI